MKTLGFSNKSVVSQFVMEGIAVTFIGCVIGAIVGVIAYPTLSKLLLSSTTNTTGPGAVAAAVSTNPAISIVLIAFVAVLAMGALGSIYPAWKASRIKPVEALRNE